MADLKDGTQSRQKAEYISHEIITRGKSEYVQLSYKRLDGDNPGAVNKAGAFVSVLDKESRDRIKAGGTFVVVKTKEGEYWNLTKVDDVSTYVAKAPYTGGGGGKSYGKSSTGSTGGGSYSNEGARKGQAINLAVHEALTVGKQNDEKFITERYKYYLQLAETLQNSETTTATKAATEAKTTTATPVEDVSETLEQIQF